MRSSWIHACRAARPMAAGPFVVVFLFALGGCGRIGLLPEPDGGSGEVDLAAGAGDMAH